MPNFCDLPLSKNVTASGVESLGKLTFMPVFPAKPLYRVDSMAFSKRPAKLAPG